MQVPKEATLNLGKKGVTEEFLLEVEHRLKKEKVLKIKILRSARKEEKEGIAKKISRKVDGKVIDVRGNTFTLKKNAQ